MTLVGWTLPQTATGRSSIVSPPPWHYSGEIIAVDFTAPVDAVAALLPDGFSPSADGAASVVFADWCSASDHDERVIADPAVGQYREAYVVLHASRAGARVGRVPFIWVDSELSLLRGQIQGFPKKLGQIAMTRPVALGRGGVRKAQGGRFAAHASSHGRRVLTASVTLEGVAERLPRAATLPLVHTRLFPSMEGSVPAVHELQFGNITGFEHGAVHTGRATLELGRTEYEEIEALGPVTVGAGHVFSLAFSVVGGRVEPL
ncbi:MAG TPA: acetoacetate decarboxylase family protein [Polyangiaceae bacterium]|nr:acetoacetate decarboxylase family protein [Polyangiaceae bacterium]